MDKESKLKRLTEILNEWVTYMKLFKDVRVEVITKTRIDTNKQYTYKDCHGYEQVGNILGFEKIPPTEFIRVTYYKCTKEGWDNVFQGIEFPMEKLDKRIEHYENKVKYMKEKLLDKVE